MVQKTQWGSAVDFDEEGFLREPRQWSEPLAREIAANLGIPELSEAHWQFVRYLREHYLKYQNLPVMEHVSRAIGLGKDAWRTLFDGGPLQAWKIAGLPDPGIEAKTYMENELEWREDHQE